jgi:uncharacterized OsmC-like protein
MSTTVTSTIRNGVDTATMYATLDAIKDQPELAKFQWRARNTWLGGAHNRTSINDFYAAGGEDTSRSEAFLVDAGEPPILLGHNEGPNPVEFYLHALAACVTTSMVYVASARKIELTSVSSELAGDMNVQGALGISPDYRNGLSQIRMTITVTGNAPAEKLREVVRRATQRSAVFDMVTHGVPVNVDVETP